MTTTGRIDPATPTGTWVWCCHHEVLVEVLTEQAGGRSAYIDATKPAHEQAVRHQAFQVVLRPDLLPAAVLAARQAYDDATQACDDAWRAYDDAKRAYYDAGQACDDAGRAYNDTRRAYNDTRRAYDDAGQACDDAWRAYDDARHQALPDLLTQCRAEYPGIPVSDHGYLIFPSEDTTP